MKTSISGIIAVLCLGISASLFARDTTEVRMVGPGIKYVAINDLNGPWTIDVLEIDITNPFINLESVKALDRTIGQERTSSMAARKDAAGHTVVGAINGDFYIIGSGQPTHHQVLNDEFVIALSSGGMEFGWTAGKKPLIEDFRFVGKVITAKGPIYSLTGVNIGQQENSLVLFNHYGGTTAPTSNVGNEVALTPLPNKEWRVNDTMICAVTEKRLNQGSTPVPLNGAILTGTDSVWKGVIENNFQMGDTVKVYLGLRPDFGRITQTMGGSSRIVLNGAPYAGETVRHPRTMLGFTRDSLKVLFVTVDGRQSTSIGMNWAEMADLMIYLGAYQAINFDGGGSTTMVVRGAIVNSPSDAGGERSNANGLLVISSAPKDTIKYLTVFPKIYRIVGGDTVTFSSSGFDQYYNPVALPSGRISWVVDPRIGTITPSGHFTAARVQDSGYVYAVYNGWLRDSAFIILKGIKSVQLSPKKLTMDSLQEIQCTVGGIDTDGMPVELEPSLLQWQYLGSNGIINMSGLFRATATGTGKIIGTYGTLKDTSLVDVQRGVGLAMLDTMPSIASWSLTGFGIDDTSYSRIGWTDTVTGSQGGALRLDYRFTYQTVSGHLAHLNTWIPIYGRPESLMVDLYSNGEGHVVEFRVVDRFGEQFKKSSPTEAGYWIGQFKRVGVYAKGFGEALDYPIAIDRISIFLQKNFPRTVGTTYSGTIFLDNVRLKYTNRPPKFVSTPDTVAYVDSLFRYLYRAIDAENDPVSFVIKAMPSWLQNNLVEKSLTGIPRLSNRGDTVIILEATDPAGSVVRQTSQVHVKALTGIQSDRQKMPSHYALNQNYPNPYNPSTRISFALPKGSRISLVIYDLLGRKIGTVVDQNLEAGYYSVDWHANNLPSGVYLCRLEAGSFVAVRKMMLLR